MNKKVKLLLGCCAVFFCVSGSVSYCEGITYTAATANTSAGLNSTATSSDSTASGTSVDCHGNLTATHGKTPQPQSILDNTDTCKRWLGWIGISPASQEEYKMQYDTLRHYIESCGKNDDSYHAFNGLDPAVQGYAPYDTTRYDRYRDWLLSVIYLNTTQPYYFCACMTSISNTYFYGKYNLPNARLAVLVYLRNDSFCDDPGLEQDIKNIINYRHQHWLEGDTVHIKEDTTLPPLDSIGLGVVLHHSLVASPNIPLPSQYLASFISSPNPFIKETTLQFTLNRMTYTTVAVYDDLGRLVWGDGRGASLEAGEHTIHLDASHFPSGTLYARISTGFGEVKTVKLIHEK